MSTCHNDQMTPQERVKKLRQDMHMTQAAFVDAFGIPRRTLQYWESGKSTPPQYVIDLLEFKISHISKN